MFKNINCRISLTKIQKWIGTGLDEIEISSSLRCRDWEVSRWRWQLSWSLKNEYNVIIRREKKQRTEAINMFLLKLFGCQILKLKHLTEPIYFSFWSSLFLTLLLVICQYQSWTTYKQMKQLLVCYFVWKIVFEMTVGDDKVFVCLYYIYLIRSSLCYPNIFSTLYTWIFWTIKQYIWAE